MHVWDSWDCRAWSICLTMRNYIKATIQGSMTTENHHDKNKEGCGRSASYLITMLNHKSRDVSRVGTGVMCVSCNKRQDLHCCPMLRPWVKPSPAWGKQMRPATKTYCLTSVMSDRHHWRPPGRFIIPPQLSVFSPRLTNKRLVYCKELKSFLTSTGEVNKSHYPPVSSLIEFKPIMKETIRRMQHIIGGFISTWRQKPV